MDLLVTKANSLIQFTGTFDALTLRVLTILNYSRIVLSNEFNEYLSLYKLV